MIIILYTIEIANSFQKMCMYVVSFLFTWHKEFITDIEKTVNARKFPNCKLGSI